MHHSISVNKFSLANMNRNEFIACCISIVFLLHLDLTASLIIGGRGDFDLFVFTDLENN